jgi:hypothetical protein
MGTNDPLKLPRWTLPQALAWMIHKTPEAVSLADGKEVFDVANEAIRRDGVDDTTKSAALRQRDELYDRLCDETLTAYGIARGQSEHSQIPALAWHTIDCFYNYDGRCEADPDDAYCSGESPPRYREVFVRPKDVLRLWSLGEVEGSLGSDPPLSGDAPAQQEVPQPGPSAAKVPTMSLADMCKLLPAFLKERSAKAQENGGPFNQVIARSDAEAQFGRRIPRPEFRKVYGDAGVQRPAGRPQKSRSKIPPKS